MRIALVVLLAVSMATSLAVADNRTNVSTGAKLVIGNVLPEPPGDVVAFWSQAYDVATCTAWSSEEKYEHDCLSADDFLSESGDTIVMVDWWGHERDFPAGEGVPEIDEFIIRFYENDTTGVYQVPGTTIYEEHIFDFTVDYLGISEKYYYSCEIPGGFVPNPGEKYWLSIVAVNPFLAANQQWYWYECDPEDYWGAEAPLKSEFWGYPEWTPWSVRNYDNHHVEMAFILYSRGDTPVEDKSWGQIKAMFR